MPVIVADDASCVALGTGKVLEDFTKLKHVLFKQIKMAILANRVKNSSNSLELIRIISNTLKRFFVIFGLGLSVYLFFTTPKKYLVYHLK